MTNAFIALDYTDLALAALLIVLNGGLSLWLGLGLERQLGVATLRLCVQLGLMGLVLKALFDIVSPWLTLAAALVMVLFAGYEIRARQDTQLRGWWSYGLGAGAILFAGGLVAIFALTVLVQPDPWYDPRYVIPLLGMILGNAMTGIAVGLNNLTDRMRRERSAIETMLALGETRGTAFRPAMRAAVRAGLIPIVNSMSAAGIVFLPGMMTGQILSGIDPVEAIKYQVMIMFLLAGGTGLGVVAAVQVAALLLSDSRQRLRLDRLAVD